MQRSQVARAAGTGVLVLLGLGGLAAACAPGADGSAATGTSGAASTTTTGTPAGSLVERQRLPPGFPVLPGARPAPLADDDPGLISAWRVEERGMAAYDFYVAALPAAGYRVEGLYPGGEWAIIRFRRADGVVWQLLVHGTGAGPVEVEVRLDRP
jgi:hypothetical protein